jgi:hypothetical protein
MILLMGLRIKRFGDPLFVVGGADELGSIEVTGFESHE